MEDQRRRNRKEITALRWSELALEVVERGRIAW